MAVTYTVSITDKNSMTVFSRATLAEGTTSTIWADKYDEIGTTIVESKLLRTPLAGPVTITITASAATTGTFHTYIYFEHNGAVSTLETEIALDDGLTGSATLVPAYGYLVGVACTVGAIPSPSESPSVSPSASPSNPGN